MRFTSQTKRRDSWAIPRGVRAPRQKENSAMERWLRENRSPRARRLRRRPDGGLRRAASFTRGDCARIRRGAAEIMAMKPEQILLDLVAIPSVSPLPNRPVIEYAEKYLAGWKRKRYLYRDAAGV